MNSKFTEMITVPVLINIMISVEFCCDLTIVLPPALFFVIIMLVFSVHAKLMINYRIT